jgi:hypothetical protein
MNLPGSFGALFDALAVAGFSRTTEGLTGSVLDRRSVKS